jgi:hypothetical protein
METLPSVPSLMGNCRIVIGLTAYAPISRCRVPWPLIWAYGHIGRLLRVALIYSGRTGKLSQSNIIRSDSATERSKSLIPIS